MAQQKNFERPAVKAVTFSALMFIMMSTHAAYTLRWSDEFNSGTIGTKWNYQTGNGSQGWGNFEAQYYTNSTSNSSIVSDSAANGGKALRITLTKTGASSFSCWMGPCAYTSARLNSKAYFQRGRLEARIKHTQAAGFWPAFWMLGQNYRTGTVWPDCGEIDIMEQRNTENVTIGTIHWRDHTGQYAYYTGSGATSSQGSYHTYTVLWTDTMLTWSVDGVQFHAASIAGSVNGTDEFHKPFYVLLNFAAGTTSTPFTNFVPAVAASGTMHVDYVRLYQDTAVPGTSCTSC
jgi:beta-glucanase (GH16 family)